MNHRTGHLDILLRVRMESARLLSRFMKPKQQRLSLYNFILYINLIEEIDSK